MAECVCAALQLPLRAHTHAQLVGRAQLSFFLANALTAVRRAAAPPSARNTRRLRRSGALAAPCSAVCPTELAPAALAALPCECAD